MSGLSTPIACEQAPKIVYASVIDQAFAAVYMFAIADRDSVSRLHSDEVARLEGEEREVEQSAERIGKLTEGLILQKERLIDAVAKGLAEEDIVEKVAGINKELANLQDQRQELQKALLAKREATDELLEAFSAENLETFMKAKGKVQRDMLRRVLKSAVVDGRSIRVELTSGRVFQWEYNPKNFDIQAFAKVKLKSDKRWCMPSPGAGRGDKGA